MAKKRSKRVKKKSSQKVKKSHLVRKLVLYFIGVTAVTAAFLTFMYYLLIVWFPGKNIRRENIMKILARHTVVYYDDGKHEVGSFFGTSYRIYVPLSRIPLTCKEAVIAAEDKWFYKHPGFNPIAMLRALFVDLKAGRIVQGGSTITQQTAKNLFGRRGRTVTEKIRELVNALRLERYYTKNEILEFYLNQFYVKGQGRGIGVAARYFFNKDVGDLTLKECAFIAGSVKGPARYDIFRAKNKEEEKKIWKRINKRIKYVLTRMYADGFISRSTYERALKEKLNFRMGVFKQKPNVMMDVISQVLESPEFQELWDALGIKNIYTAGLKIYTSLDYDIEKEAIFTLRKRLSLLDTILKGYQSPDVKFVPSYPQLEKGFYIGKIMAKKASEFSVFLKAPSPLVKKVDVKKCPEIATADYFYRSGKWVSPGAAVRRFMRRLRRGNFVLLSYDGKNLCVEKLPLLQGAVLVTQAGKIKAMVGGFSNLFYNRAWIAKRQHGSIFKIPLYLEYFLLGQLNTDPYPDEREMYIYQGQIYFPRPDHPPHTKIVSLAWAGAYSENLATINLLFNLFNMSPEEDIEKLAHWTGLLSESGDLSRKQVKELDDEGIIFSKKLLFCSLVEEVAREKVRNEGFQLSPQEVFSLRNLRCDPAIRGVRNQLLLEKNPGPEDKFKLKMTAYDYDFLIKKVNYIKNKIGNGDYSGLKIYLKKGDYYVCTTSFSPCEGEIVQSLPPFAEDNFWVEGVLPLNDLEEIKEKAESKLDYLLSNYSLFSDKVLFHLKDFRVLLALRCYKKLLEIAGVVSPIKEVPSLPLGSSGITLPELSLIYTLISQGYKYSVSDQPYGLSLIKKITYEGKEVYNSKVDIIKVFNDRYVAMVDSVLEKVFQIGTAKRQREKMTISVSGKKYYLPVMGKTGTTNNFTNSSFVGIVPVITRDGVSLTSAGGFVVTGYVGYDNNMSMKRWGYKVFGSNGALPVVADIMKKIIDRSNFQNIISFGSVKGNYVSLEMPPDFQWYEVDPMTGISLAPLENITDVDITQRIETTDRRIKLWLPEE